ncbi:hypothetical protein Bca52824_001782 [Brassica carinata]|uniref:Uncharacterized protein n=1 Tax=Brassica carinata TaxID=52824 RepID=A0A8X7WJM9_BRACI|nr:hypothetical protein Bca52824_001782 [Brassica carinata]
MVGVAVWCQIGTLVVRSISFLLPSLFALLRWVRGFTWLDASWVPSGGGAVVLLFLVWRVSGGSMACGGSWVLLLQIKLDLLNAGVLGCECSGLFLKTAD